ncbi:MAG: tetratricopeptide repeat protein [Planctomycetaceae bacterium]|nr:tetratricopeptide repeat protein [Planctomycetaceae bacterium]
MAQKKHDDPSQDTSPNTRGVDQPEQTSGKELPEKNLPGQTVYDRALQHAATGNYQKALDLLRSAPRDLRVQNAIGVCLIRLGRTEDAVRVFRDFVLGPGGFGIDPDAPLIARVNYATSLLLEGRPVGCLDALAGVRGDKHPAVQRLQAVIKEWERSLSFWQRLNWRFGRIEPRDAPVKFDFPPGEFEVELPDQTGQE